MTSSNNIAAAVAALSPEQRAALLQALAGPPEGIAIVGVGCRLPAGAAGPDGLWSLLSRGVDGIREIPTDRWDVDALYDPDPNVAGKMSTRWGSFLDDVRGFDEGYFKISPREAAAMDPQQRIMLEVVVEALEDAAAYGPQLAGSRTGVYVGVSAVEYALLGWPLTSIDAYASSGTSKSILANRISYQFDLRGPSLAIDTACSSSLVAAHLACKSLRSKETDLALVGGVNVIVAPTLSVSYSKWGMMAPDGRCKTFDARADGFVRGEGCGVVVLKRLSDAQAAGDRIYAVIRGSAINQDGRSAGLTAPNLEAQIGVIKEALKDARLSPEQISYVEAHGTGTALGDPIEIEALAEALKGSGTPCAIGSIKTNLGHLEGAAGIAGLLKLALALRHRAIPPHLHLETINPKLHLERTPFRIPRSLEPWSANHRVGAVSSFGFGGTNAHLILEEAPPPPAPPVEGRSRVLVLSAATPAALTAQIQGYAARLEARPGDFAALAEVNLRRGHRHLHRAGVVASSGPDAAAALRSLLEGPASPYAVAAREARRRAPKLAFVMTGQGSAWAGMGQRLLARSPLFRAALLELDEAARPVLGWSVLQALERADPGLLSTERAQPAIFLLQLGLVRLLAAYRVVPAAVVGHSVGELSAAVVAGALTLQDALRIIRLRAELMASHEGRGGMIEVARSAEELRAALEGSSLSVAAVNRRQATVIAGPKDDLARFSDQQRAEGVVVRPLDVGCAFHGRALRAEAPRLVQAIGVVAGATPRTPLYSTVTGGLAPTLDAAYFGRNLGDPVLFAPAIERMAQDGVELFLELGPHASLTRDLEAILGAPRAIASLLRGRDDELRIDAALLALECEGVTVDWSPRTPELIAPVSPPLYPWQHQRRWGTGAQASRPDAALGHPLLKARIMTPGLSRPVFELALDSEIVTQHRFGGQALFPTVGVVEAARAAAALIGQPRSGVVELTVSRPLLARPEEGQKAQLILGEEGDFEVVASADPAAGAPWNVHFRGRFAELTAPPSITPQALPGAGGTGADYYAELGQRGADFGAYFRRVEAWSSEPDRARAQLNATPNDPEAITAGLDVALHLYWAALAPEQRPGHGGFLPVAFEAIGVHAPLERAAWAEVHLRERGPDRMVADAGLYDAEGRAVLSFRGIHYRPADLPGAELERVGRQDVYVERWEEGGASVTSGPGRWQVIGEVPDLVAAARAELQAAGAELVDDPAGAQVLDLSAWGRVSTDPQVYLQDNLLQAARLLSRGPKVWVRVTERAVALPGELGNPAVVALDGLLAVARLERPQVRVRGIDADTWSGVVQASLHSDEDRLVLRQGRSWVPRLHRAPLTLTPSALRGDAAYVISGGGGGLGLAVARDFLARGARNLWLLGRTPLPDAELALLREAGAEVQFRAVDVRDRAAVFEFWRETRGAVDGIVHAAGVVEDQRLDQLEPAAIARVLGAKVSGVINLDQASAQQPLSFFVAVSSAAGVLGGQGQAAYAVANAYLDAYCARRRGEGRPFQSIAFGPFAGVGMAARLGAGGQQRAAALGVQGLDPKVAGACVLGLRTTDRSLVLRADWERLLAGRGELQSPYFGRLRAARGTTTVDHAFLSELRSAPDRVRSSLMLARIRHQLAAVLAVDRPDSIPSDVGLFELGLDSMTAVELTEGLQAKLGARLPATLVFEQPTLQALSQHLVAQLAPPEAAPQLDELTGKSEADLIRLLEQELNAEGVGG